MLESRFAYSAYLRHRTERPHPEGELDHISSALLRLRGENPFGYLKTLTGLLPYILPKCTELESEAKEKKPLTWFTDQNPFE